MTNRDELKRLADCAEELERGYDGVSELATQLADKARRMSADSRMVKLRAQAVLADLTPIRPPSVSALEATRTDSRSGKTRAGGIRIDPYKPTKG